MGELHDLNDLITLNQGMAEWEAWKLMATYLEKKLDVNLSNQLDLTALIAEWGYQFMLLRSAQDSTLDPIFQSDLRIDRLKKEYPQQI